MPHTPHPVCKRVSTLSREREIGLVRATIPYAREQPLRSWWHLISTTAILATLLGAAASPLAWWARLAAALLAGLLVTRLFVIYHDFQHKAILRGSRLARGYMWLFGLLSLNPVSAWNRSHEYHHKHTAQLKGASHGSFPVLTTTSYAAATWRQRLTYSIQRHPLTLLAGYATVFLFSMCLLPLITSPRRHYDCAAAVLVHGGLIALLAVFSPMAMLFAVILPMAIAAALGAYLFYVQHNFPEVDLRERSEWDYVFAALHSSSYLDIGPMMHWLTGNIGYHHVHHLNARIPFYRLPEAMRHMKALQAPARSTLEIAEIYRCLRLKLWCPVRQCMVRARG
ncbi:MAG: fatty acid desaturase [Phycisphaeraceae bacterium]|nr:fatty acid desaturase [Phycisphaeraceae bacterium]